MRYRPSSDRVRNPSVVAVPEATRRPLNPEVGIGTDCINESARGDVSHDEQENGEQEKSNRDEQKLAGFLGQAEPLELIGKVHKLTLARPASRATCLRLTSTTRMRQWWPT